MKNIDKFLVINKHNKYLTLLLLLYLSFAIRPDLTAQMVIVSDGTWKGSSILQNGWETISFDDTNWSYAISPALTGVTTIVNGSKSMWVNGIPTDAYFRKKINLSGVGIKKSTLEISADNEYKVYVNGKLVAAGIALWTTHTHDVSGFLQCGDNVIAIRGIEWIPGTPSLVSCKWVLDTFVSAPFTTNLKAVICEKDTFLGYSESGIYRDTFKSKAGCDSIRVLDLIKRPTVLSVVNHAICKGESYVGYSAAGTYRDTFYTFQGCDSIRLLSLTLKPPILSTIKQTICVGQDYAGYTSSGIYRDTFSTTNNCDSIRVLHLTQQPSVQSFIKKNICEGDIFEGYTLPGIYKDTYRAINGCDSIRTLQLLRLNKLNTTDIQDYICLGERYGKYDQEGVYIDTFRLTNNCDSVRILHLTAARLYIPNAFSPNDDGQNDYFMISDVPGSGIELKRIAIYDRWGNQVYSNSHILPNTPLWDGSHRQKMLPPGIYVYFLAYRCQNKEKIWKGDITLVR